MRGRKRSERGRWKDEEGGGERNMEERRGKEGEGGEEREKMKE